jgi:hypothetical protein
VVLNENGQGPRTPGDRMADDLDPFDAEELEQIERAVAAAERGHGGPGGGLGASASPLQQQQASSRAVDYLATATIRQQQIGEREAALAALRKAHEGKRGAYNKKDKATKDRLDKELHILRRGERLEDYQPASKPTEAAVLQSAKASSAVHNRLAHPQHPPSGRSVLLRVNTRLLR